MTPKRQIIKTRPQRPYVVARVILAIIAVLAIALALWWSLHPHPAHALMHAHVGGADVVGTTFVTAFSRQEALIAARMPPLRTTVERIRS